MRVADISEFRRLEQTVVERINSFPNGGRLFVADPFRLLSDIGVELSPAAKEGLEAELAHTSGFPVAPFYDAIRRSETSKMGRVVVRGILRR